MPNDFANVDNGGAGLPGSPVDPVRLGFPALLAAFGRTEPIAAARELRAGNINTTYLAILDGGEKLTLQKINRHVFKQPEMIMSNIRRVTAHLRGKLPPDAPDPSRRVLSFMEKADGSMIEWDASGEPWRCYRFVEGATAYNAAVKPEHLCETGRAFGAFQRDLADFPIETLSETITGFHDTPKRYSAFIQAVEADRVGRRAAASRQIEAVRDRSSLASRIVDQLSGGALPLRVTHNDTKINNVLIDDSTEEAICVIDLDTVMPGSSLYDFGDMIRFGASSAAEDEPDVSKIDLDMGKYEQFAKGFIDKTRGFLSDSELIAQPLGCLVITYELAMRFLTDYLDGDRYFRVWDPEHNLIRARAQLRLLEDMESKYDAMTSYIKENIVLNDGSRDQSRR
ncbi:MAG: aminoglycoside phosphotransferase family protein [Oscillospiraceae bacterium]|nr:aminoglycoside phosphotransferase family protein [Oscillospiraceae bacterium]